MMMLVAAIYASGIGLAIAIVFATATYALKLFGIET